MNSLASGLAPSALTRAAAIAPRSGLGAARLLDASRLAVTDDANGLFDLAAAVAAGAFRVGHPPSLPEAQLARRRERIEPRRVGMPAPRTVPARAVAGSQPQHRAKHGITVEHDVSGRGFRRIAWHRLTVKRLGFVALWLAREHVNRHAPSLPERGLQRRHAPIEGSLEKGSSTRCGLPGYRNRVSRGCSKSAAPESQASRGPLPVAVARSSPPWGAVASSRARESRIAQVGSAQAGDIGYRAPRGAVAEKQT